MLDEDTIPIAQWQVWDARSCLPYSSRACSLICMHMARTSASTTSRFLARHTSLVCLYSPSLLVKLQIVELSVPLQCHKLDLRLGYHAEQCWGSPQWTAYAYMCPAIRACFKTMATVLNHSLVPLAPCADFEYTPQSTASVSLFEAREDSLITRLTT